MDQSPHNPFPCHGGNINAFAAAAGLSPNAVTDFSSNINPLGLSSKLERVYHKSTSVLTRYPDPYAQELCACVADRYNVAPSGIIAGNGSMALMDLAVRAIKPKTALIVEPCFTEYRRLLQLHGAAVHYVPLNPEDDFHFSVDKIIEHLPGMDCVMIGHPNNPTGTALERAALTRLMTETNRRGIALIIDEAFVDWCEERSVIHCVCDYSSVIVVRSLTKFYALAGIRVGYACASQSIVDRIRRLQETWSCNGLAQTLAVAALDDTDFQTRTRQWFAQEAAFMCKALSAIPWLHIVPSLANFFLCRIEYEACQQHFWPAMTKAGLYLRDVTDFTGLGPAYVRLALRGREDNLALLEGIGDVSVNRIENGLL